MRGAGRGRFGTERGHGSRIGTNVGFPGRDPGLPPRMSGGPSALERAAIRNLVRNYLSVQRDENVIVDTWSHSLRMATTVVDEVRRVGGRAFLAYEDDDVWWRAVERKQTELLGRLSEPYWAALGAADVYVMFWGPGDSARIERVPAQRMDETTGWFDRWYKTARSAGLRGARMDVGFVTEPRVRHWGVSKRAWREGLLRACLVDPDEMTRSGESLSRALAGRKRVRITHPNGTDVEVGLAGARSVIADGTVDPKDRSLGPYGMMANVPGGEFLIALDAKTAEGTMVATEPSYDLTWYPWRTYRGGTFTFSGGRLIWFSFEKGEAGFAKHYARAKPGKDRTGILTIGLNPAAKRLPLAEVIQRGSVRLTVGSNANLGGTNLSDFCGWITTAGAEVTADGVPIVRSGRVL